MADAKRLAALSMVPPLAVEVAAQMETGGLQIGTTATTAMAGNRTPTTTIRGGVLSVAAITDLATDADLPTTVLKVNAILAALRTAGIVTA